MVLLTVYMYLYDGFYHIYLLHENQISYKSHYQYDRYYRKIHCLTSEFHVKFHLKNRYRTHRVAIRAILVFQVKFNVEFTSQAVNFS